MAKEIDHKYSADPKSPKNPINQQDESGRNPQDFNPINRGEDPTPVTDDEIRFLNTIDPKNPKNLPRK
jgi:hypothetical protein